MARADASTCRTAAKPFFIDSTDQTINMRLIRAPDWRTLRSRQGTASRSLLGGWGRERNFSASETLASSYPQQCHRLSYLENEKMDYDTQLSHCKIIAVIVLLAESQLESGAAQTTLSRMRN
ncbi:hypothetical protein M3J07_010255 [Ascochyta lentis]